MAHNYANPLMCVVFFFLKIFAKCLITAISKAGKKKKMKKCLEWFIMKKYAVGYRCRCFVSL